MTSTISNSVEARRRSNRLIANLRDDDWSLLAPHLEASDFTREEVLFHQGEDVRRCCFPCDGMVASLRVCATPAATCVKFARLARRARQAGGIISHGHAPAFTSAVTAAPGPALIIAASKLDAIKRKSPTIERLFARYADCLLAQIMQASACNALHDVEQRIARWLLGFDDRLGGSRILVTQEALAAALGVGRPYASRQLKSLESKRLIRLRRGAIEIQDRSALERHSCPCYQAVRDHFATVISGLYPPPPAEALRP